MLPECSGEKAAYYGRFGTGSQRLLGYLVPDFVAILPAFDAVLISQGHKLVP
jgi:hypothetical protein